MGEYGSVSTLRGKCPCIVPNLLHANRYVLWQRRLQSKLSLRQDNLVPRSLAFETN
jgi:hypothetical protein